MCEKRTIWMKTCAFYNFHVAGYINSGQGWIQVLWSLKLNQFGGLSFRKSANTKISMKNEILFKVREQMKTNQVHFFSDLYRLFTGNAYIEMLH